MSLYYCRQQLHNIILRTRYGKLGSSCNDIQFIYYGDDSRGNQLIPLQRFVMVLCWVCWKLAVRYGDHTHCYCGYAFFSIRLLHLFYIFQYVRVLYRYIDTFNGGIFIYFCLSVRWHKSRTIAIYVWKRLVFRWSLLKCKLLGVQLTLYDCHSCQSIHMLGWWHIDFRNRSSHKRIQFWLLIARNQ